MEVPNPLNPLSFRMSLYNPEAQKVMREYEARLRCIFHYYTGTPMKNLTRAAMGTISIRQYLFFLKDMGVLVQNTVAQDEEEENAVEMEKDEHEEEVKVQQKAPAAADGTFQITMAQAFEYFIKHDDDLDGETDTRGGVSMFYNVDSEIIDMEFIEGLTRNVHAQTQQKLGRKAQSQPSTSTLS